jgi:hypothetical protein
MMRDVSAGELLTATAGGRVTDAPANRYSRSRMGRPRAPSGPPHEKHETDAGSAEPLPRWITEPNCDLGPDPADPRACLYGHKSAGGSLRWAGEVISLAGEMGGSTEERRARVVRRGVIVEWSGRSRGRLVKMVLASAAAKWGELEDPTRILLVTLTYPGQEGREYIPRDGRITHRQRGRFLERWERRFGGCRCVWKLEFQARAGDWPNDWERCAPHWTLWMDTPREVRLLDVREWVSRSWWEIVGSKAQAHLHAGTRVEPWRGPLVAYALKYMRKERDKEYQHRVPEGYVNVGRWWGLVGLRVRWVKAPLSERQFFTVRRLVIRSRRGVRRRRGRLRVRGRYAGMWMWTRRHGVARTGEMVNALMRGTQLAIEGSPRAQEGDTEIAAPPVKSRPRGSTALGERT